jgi:GNAT superfamily N-acetyltransferase
MKAYQIRAIRENEMDTLMLLIREHTTYEKVDYTDQNKKERLYQAIFEKPHKLTCWVVEFDGKISGFCSFTIDYSTWDAARYLYMDCLYLSEDIRGLGIGTDIISRLRQIAVDNNYCCLQWQTPVFNLPAIAFYHKIGASSKEKMRFTLPI